MLLEEDGCVMNLGACSDSVTQQQTMNHSDTVHHLAVLHLTITYVLESSSNDEKGSQALT